MGERNLLILKENAITFKSRSFHIGERHLIVNLEKIIGREKSLNIKKQKRKTIKFKSHIDSI